MSADKESLVRLNVNLNAETAEALRGISESRGVSYTEATRRAIAVYKFLEDENAGGRKFQMVDDDGYVRELVLL